MAFIESQFRCGCATLDTDGLLSGYVQLKTCTRRTRRPRRIRLLPGQKETPCLRSSAVKRWMMSCVRESQELARAQTSRTHRCAAWEDLDLFQRGANRCRNGFERGVLAAYPRPPGGSKLNPGE